MKHSISEASYRRLTGELQDDGRTRCDVMTFDGVPAGGPPVPGCDRLAICRVGCGAGHPSCEEHAQMADYISPLRPEEE